VSALKAALERDGWDGECIAALTLMMARRWLCWKTRNAKIDSIAQSLGNYERGCRTGSCGARHGRLWISIWCAVPRTDSPSLAI